MIKFYTGIKFTNQGDGIYFITPTDGTLAHIYIVAGQTVEKVAEINSINASDVNEIKENLQKQITQNATDVASALAGLKAITDKHGATLEKLEKKVDDNTAAHEANATSITKIISGETPVAKATNADNATKATQDGDGNVITSTYATKDEYYAHFDSAHGTEQNSSFDRERYEMVEGWVYETVTVWVVDQKAYTETVVIGRRCSVCGTEES